jgi:hypothetical protein
MYIYIYSQLKLYIRITYFSVTKIGCLVLFIEIVTVSSENHPAPINALCGQKAKLKQVVYVVITEL